MPALTFDSKDITYSLSYDTLTMYPNFPLDRVGAMKGIMSECGLLFFVQSIESTEKGTAIIDCNKEIATVTGRIRYVHNDEDDHALYHRDSIDHFKNHFHLHFHKMLTQEQLEQILNILVNRKMMDSSERANFLKAFTQRYNDSRQLLDKQLESPSSSESKEITGSQNKRTATNIIINFIKSCQDNDILVDLHNYFEMDKFRYLRDITKSKQKIHWQGTNALNQVVETSESWAMIEKAFTLQMAHNIEANCSHFSKEIAKDFATKMAENHRFFSLKHHKGTFTWNRSTSPSYDAFRNHNKDVFDQKYEHFFRVRN